MLLKSVLSLLLPLAAGFVPAAVQQRAPQAACPRAAAVVQMTASQPLGRRAALASLLALGLAPQVAEASGGATAGKYTTIPIAKRRYFGRVKQGVYEFLELGAEVKKGNLDSIEVTGFFSQTLKIQSKRRKSKCIASDSCEVQDKFSSRFEDMKLCMFLLGNAFRMDSGKPPEKVKQVKEAKAFFAQVGRLERSPQPPRALRPRDGTWPRPMRHGGPLRLRARLSRERLHEAHWGAVTRGALGSGRTAQRGAALDAGGEAGVGRQGGRQEADGRAVSSPALSLLRALPLPTPARSALRHGPCSTLSSTAHGRSRPLTQVRCCDRGARGLPQRRRAAAHRGRHVQDRGRP